MLISEFRLLVETSVVEAVIAEPCRVGGAGYHLVAKMQGLTDFRGLRAARGGPRRFRTLDALVSAAHDAGWKGKIAVWFPV